MSIRTTIARGAGLALAVVATTATLGLTGTASADTARPDSAPAAGSAPSCVYAYETTDTAFDNVTVLNQCDNRVRVLVQTTFAPDSSCQSLSPGNSFRHSYPRPGNFVGVVNC